MYHQPKVSVIIPCYNSEKHLQKAVNSVINQSLDELQIILIDDGSSDKTATLLQQYKMRDNRVEVVMHQKNKGLGPARNSGIEKATGDFLFFLDSDDYIHQNALEVLYEQAHKNNLDILQALLIRHENGQKTICPKNLPLLEQPLNAAQYFQRGFFIDPKACGKLWLTEFIKTNGLKFASGYYEDIAIVFYAFSIAQRIDHIQFAAYHYIFRDDSITQQMVTKAHVSGFKNSLTDLQQLFTRSELTRKSSAFPPTYFLFLSQLALLALKTKDPAIIMETETFVNQMTKKYKKYLTGNRLLPFYKRRLLKYAPFTYAKLKTKFKKAD